MSPWSSDGVVGTRVANGDGQLFYDSWSAPNVTQPSVGSGEFEVCPSLRWENFALGLQDYELLHLAGTAEAEAAARSGSSNTRRGRGGAEWNVSQLVGLISQGWAHVQPAFDQPFTVDCTMLEWVRGELAQIAGSGRPL